MEVQKLFLAVANEPGADGIEVNVQVPSGYDIGIKEGETVLFRRKPRMQKVMLAVRGQLGGMLTELMIPYGYRLVGGRGDRFELELDDVKSEWRAGMPVQASPDELTEELKPTGREPITATEVAGSLGTLGEEQFRSERNRAAFEQAKNTLSGHNMAPSGFEPIHACRCEQCRRHRGERL